MNKRAVHTVLIVGIFAFVMAIFSGVSSASNFGQVCVGLTSGKIDVSGSYKTITFTAPAGKLISRYCVKSGSINQDLGPEYVDVNPPATSVVISHSSGKDISHYSVEYIDYITTTSTTITTTTTASTTTSTTTTEPTTTSSSTTTTESTTTEPTTTTSTTTTTEPTTTTQPTTTTSKTSSTSTSTSIPSTTTIIPTTTTSIVTTTTEPSPSIMYQTIDRLAYTGSDVYILAGIGLLMILVGSLAVIIDRKSNKVD